MNSSEYLNIRVVNLTIDTYYRRRKGPSSTPQRKDSFEEKLNFRLKMAQKQRRAVKLTSSFRRAVKPALVKSKLKKNRIASRLSDNRTSSNLTINTEITPTVSAVSSSLIPGTTTTTTTNKEDMLEKHPHVIAAIQSIEAQNISAFTHVKRSLLLSREGSPPPPPSEGEGQSSLPKKGRNIDREHLSMSMANSLVCDLFDQAQDQFFWDAIPAIQRAAGGPRESQAKKHPFGCINRYLFIPYMTMNISSIQVMMTTMFFFF